MMQFIWKSYLTSFWPCDRVLNHIILSFYNSGTSVLFTLKNSKPSHGIAI